MTGFSLGDLTELESSAGELLSGLRDAGLDAIAETPADGIAEAAVLDARAAGLQVQRLTVRVAPPDPVSFIFGVRDLQVRVGGFRVFAPLARTISVTAPTTGYDDVKLVALARLAIREIPSIQVDWPLYGPKLAQVALTMGADDVDGIAAVESGAFGARRSAIEEIRRNISAAGLQAVERDGTFEVRGG